MAPREIQQLDRLAGRFEEFMRNQIEVQKDAAKGRAMIYEKLEEQGLKIDRLDAHKDGIDKRMTRVETTATDFNVWKQRFIGMAMIVALFSSFVAAAVTFVLKRFFFVN